MYAHKLYGNYNVLKVKGDLKKYERGDDIAQSPIIQNTWLLCN